MVNVRLLCIVKVERRNIKGYEGIYTICRNGTVINRHGRIISTRISNKGYLQVCLCKDGGQRSLFIHRLIAIAFIPNPQTLPQINHKDGIKLNNNISNLEWCTSKYNTRHAFANGLIKNKNRTSKLRKLGNIDVLLILVLSDAGMSTNSLATMFCVSRILIYRIRYEKRYNTFQFE